MSLAFDLPFLPGDWVRHKLFLHVARVVECCARRESFDGIYTELRHFPDGLIRAAVWSDWEPCLPPVPNLRIVHSDLRRLSPAQALVGSSGNPPASLAIRPVPECELTETQHIADTIRRHCERSDYHD